MGIQVALAGNPNSGKTTLFNNLTGARQHVGNWPGVTVEQKSGVYKQNKEIDIMDLPGIYSLSPYTEEEIVARDYIIKEKPDVVIDIVDGTNIERNLYLTLQILETGIPTVVALNMMDEVETAGTRIDVKKLSKALGVKVVPITARNGKGVDELMKVVEEVAVKKQAPDKLKIYSDKVQGYIDSLSEVAAASDPQTNVWQAIKLLENDELVEETLPGNARSKASELVNKADEALGGDAEAAIADERYQFIGGVVAQSVKKTGGKAQETRSDKIDKILTNRILAIPIFLVVMYLMFAITFGESFIGIGATIQGWVEDGWDVMAEAVGEFLEDAGAAEWAASLVENGILAGLGGIVAFIPQIVILFVLMSILEDCGYMARVAFVMDRIFRRFGLSGKSFIPLLMGFGCSVPAVMATRTLENDRDRKITMMVTPFMSCGAKMPIYLVFIASLFADSNATLITFSIYMIGIVVAIIAALILGKTVLKGEASNFIMELPQYRIPTLRSVGIHAWEKTKGFVVRAGTIIFASIVLIWFLSNFNFSGYCDMEDSILASIGNGLAFIFAPLGFGNWRAVVGVVTGWIAKENVVATLAVLFNEADEVVELVEEGEAALGGLGGIFTKASAYSFMTFNLLCMPCFAAVGAIKREMASWKWTGATVAFQMGVAWIVSLLVYGVASLIF